MELAVVIVVMLALPSLLQLVSKLVRREWEQIAAQRRPLQPPVPSIERVAADLRRLRARLESRENEPGVTGKGMKMGALRRAYVEVLEVACAQLDIRPPRRCGQFQTPLAEIYRVEAALRERGLDVRGPGYQQRRAA